MGLMNWFKGRRKDEAEANEITSQSASPAPAGDVKPPASGASEKSAVKPAPKDKSSEAPKTKPAEAKSQAHSVEDIKGVLDSINTVFEDEDRENTIVVPGLALLKSIPPELRGPNWDDGNYPDFELILEREDVLAQLKNGRITYPASTFAPMLPAGWLAVDGATMLDLDLALVVSAIPPEHLQGAREKSDVYQEVEGMKSLFTPKRKPTGAIKKQEAEVEEEAAPPTPAPEPVVEPPVVEPEAEPLIQPEPEEEAVPEVEPAAAPEPEPEPFFPEVAAEPEPEKVPEEAFALTADAGESRSLSTQEYLPVDWSGVDDSSATGGVDINTASLDELEALPGVGEVRARDIVAVRKEIGGFNHIYQLGLVPGIGPKMFRQMTGLSLTTGYSRHQTLNKLLELAPEDTPSLARICQAMCDRIGAVGCVLSTNDGVPLAQTPSVSELADRYAAISSQLFRRTGRYLRNLTGRDAECLALPLDEPPVLLFSKGDFYFVIVQDERHQSYRDLKRANAILDEICWLLGRRAIVRNM